MSTWAPERTAPEGSVTMPTMGPVPTVWQKINDEASRSATRLKTANRLQERQRRRKFKIANLELEIFTEPFFPCNSYPANPNRQLAVARLFIFRRSPEDIKPARCKADGSPFSFVNLGVLRG